MDGKKNETLTAIPSKNSTSTLERKVTQNQAELLVRWDKKGYPHKGWDEVNVVDAFELGEEDVHCEMCNTEIRNIHILKHPEIQEDIRVGCICAEHLTNDYKRPEEREKKFKQKVTWGNSKFWKRNDKGNYFRKYKGATIWVCQKKNGNWVIGIRPRGSSETIWGRKIFPNNLTAKRYSLEGYEKYMERLKKAEEKWELECLRRQSLEIYRKRNG